MNEEFAKIMYEAMFDELSSIEKESMDKEAIGAALGRVGQFISGAGKGVGQIGQMGARGTGTFLRGAYQGGKEMFAGGAGGLKGVMGGLRGVAGTAPGQAILAGAGGAAALGGAAGLGRATAPRR
jgi:hypothetical protein